MTTVYTIRDVITRYNGRAHKGQLNLKCPLCLKPKCDIAVGETKRLIASCFNCKPEGDKLLDYFGLPVRVLTDQEIAWLHDELQLVAQGSKPSSPPARVDKLHSVYSMLLKQCPLSDRHNAALLQRGLSQEAIRRNQYGTWTGDLDATWKEEEVKGVPGFHQSPLEKLPPDWIVGLRDPRYAGILVPIRDLAGRIYALKVRLDVPDAEGKMRTFSSAVWGGPSALHGIHVPLGVPEKSSKVNLVEGELKADVLFDRLKVPFIACTGTHSV